MQTVTPVPHTPADLPAAVAKMFTDKNVPYAADQWQRIGTEDFRLWPSRGCLRLWRKQHGREFFGGYRIQTVVADSRLACEWLGS